MLPSNASDWETAGPSPQQRGPRLSSGVVLTLVLLVALVAIIAFAVTRLPTGALTRPTATPATATKPAAAAPLPAAEAGTPADSATQQSIQKVIEQLDNAQAQAIANNDPQVMAATATPKFYAEQVATNDGLRRNGVTEIKLISLEWGAITVNGNSASATVYETWSTTLDTGQTEQARDRNVYTLVKDSSGAWIVEADDHPDQPSTSPGN